MNKQIQEWIDGKQDYPGGVALFEAFGNNPVMLRQFRNSRPINMRMYLAAELKKLLKATNRYEKKQKPSFVREKVNKRPPVKKVMKGTDYERVVKVRKDAFVKMAKIRNGMADMGSDKERAEAVVEVEALQKTNDDLWAASDYYDKHGKWKNGKSPLEENKQEKPRPDTGKILAKAEMEKLRKRISRAENALVKLGATVGKGSPKYIKKEKDLNGMYAERDALNKKLGR